VIGFVDTRILIAGGLTVLGMSGLMFSRLKSRHRHAKRGVAELLERGRRCAHLRLAGDHDHGTAQERAARQCGRHLQPDANIGGSIGIAAVATLLARWTQVRQSILISHLTPYDPAYQKWLSDCQPFPPIAGGLAGRRRQGDRITGQRPRTAGRASLPSGHLRMTSISLCSRFRWALLFKKTPTRKASGGH